MQNFSFVIGVLFVVFVMFGVNVFGFGNKWLNFGVIVVFGLVLVWVGGGFDGLMFGFFGLIFGFNNLISFVVDGMNGIFVILKFVNGGIFGKDGVILFWVYQKGGIVNLF